MVGTIVHQLTDGDITDKVETSKEEISDDEFHIIYKVEDTSGNKQEKTRRIFYVDDIKPVIELNGDGTVILNIGEQYKEQGAKAHDEKDGDLTDKIETSGNVDTNKEIILQGKGRTELEEFIDMPLGNNTLILKVIDIEGKTVSYSQMYELVDGDVIKPEIELLVEGSKVKIVAKDETELDYIIYYWNEEDETRVDAREDSSKQIEEKIEILKGENTLTIIAVDKAGNEEIKEQTYKGAKKPKIELSRTGNELIIKVTDEEGIQKIEYTLNGTYYSTDPQNTGASLNMKEVEMKQPLIQGENKITIKAYNISGLETGRAATAQAKQGREDVIPTTTKSKSRIVKRKDGDRKRRGQKRSKEKRRT